MEMHTPDSLRRTDGIEIATPRRSRDRVELRSPLDLLAGLIGWARRYPSLKVAHVAERADDRAAL